LSGATANAAFYVKCDAETNPPERRDGGEVVTEIGLAPSPPAELVVIRVTQREGVADLLPR
jgi:phage tail sheath protein FI